MRPSLIVSLLIFMGITYNATAQNFQPFRNKFKYQFSCTGTIRGQISNSLIHGIEVDSAKIIHSDSIFYFNKLRTSEDNFWGNSMVKKAGGEYLFLITNYPQNDTVLLKTQAVLGSQWSFKLENILYTASYESLRQETVLTNQIDYVKTFIVENASGFKDSIKISENFGLVYSFPFKKDFLSFDHFNLTYIFTTKVGVNKLNYFEYFNYDAGDILIYSPRNYGPPSDRRDNDVYKVLSKTISLDGDTIRYSLIKCHIDAVNGTTYSTTQTYCGIVVTTLSVTGNFPYISLLSFPTNKNDAYALNMYNNVLTIAYPFVHDYNPTYTYVKGLGFYSFIFHGGLYYNPKYYINTAYIKQSNTDDDCASSETILDTKTLDASSANLLVAPNPFDNVISLNATNLSQGNWTVRITSALGVEAYTSTMIISSSNQEIDLSNLPALTAGIYFLSLENESQVHSQKIVKQ